ncbi:MAG: hypothetical protein WC846_01825 [Candidatus Gracilibacteria bacterium]
MKAQTYMPPEHLGILPPEFIRAKLDQGGRLRKGDSRVATDDYEIVDWLRKKGSEVQIAINRLRPPLTHTRGGEQKVRVNIPNTGKDHHTGGIFTCTDEEHKLLQPTPTWEDEECRERTQEVRKIVEDLLIKKLGEAKIAAGALKDNLKDQRFRDLAKAAGITLGAGKEDLKTRFNLWTSIPTPNQIPFDPRRELDETPILEVGNLSLLTPEIREAIETFAGYPLNITAFRVNAEVLPGDIYGFHMHAQFFKN